MNRPRPTQGCRVDKRRRRRRRTIPTLTRLCDFHCIFYICDSREVKLCVHFKFRIMWVPEYLHKVIFVRKIPSTERRKGVKRYGYTTKVEDMSVDVIQGGANSPADAFCHSNICVYVTNLEKASDA